MKDRTLAAAIGTLAICVMAGSAAAQARFEEDFDNENKSWQEIAVQLPAPPKEENLLPFYVSPIATQRFAVDAESVSLGTDGVIRYTLVSSSEGGARNVSYEGIRCAAYERKLYAFGQADGSWSRSRRDQWERINTHAANRHHATLFKDYFCTQKSVAGSAKEMVERIRSQRTLAPQTGQ
jgi:hypothetical protein